MATIINLDDLNGKSIYVNMDNVVKITQENGKAILFFNVALPNGTLHTQYVKESATQIADILKVLADK